MARVFKEAKITNDDDFDYIYWRCPTCGEGYILENFKYCSNCGDKIEWIKSVDEFEENLKKQIRVDDLFVLHLRINPESLSFGGWMKRHFPEMDYENQKRS